MNRWRKQRKPSLRSMVPKVLTHPLVPAKIFDSTTVSSGTRSARRSCAGWLVGPQTSCPTKRSTMPLNLNLRPRPLQPQRRHRSQHIMVDPCPNHPASVRMPPAHHNRQFLPPLLTQVADEPRYPRKTTRAHLLVVDIVCLPEAVHPPSGLATEGWMRDGFGV